MELYERFGRAVEALEQEQEQHRRTIALLRGLKDGTYNLANVVVGDDNSWTLSAPMANIVIEDPDADDLGSTETPEGGLSGEEASELAAEYLKVVPQN